MVEALSQGVFNPAEHPKIICAFEGLISALVVGGQVCHSIENQNKIART